jgi:hypothetical protein
MHRRLNEIFESRLRTDYGTNVTQLAIILRVSGKVRDFKTEGPERLFFRRKGKYLEIDLAIPRKAWEGKSIDESRAYLFNGLRATFAVLKARLLKVDKSADVKSWEADFESCLEQFRSEAGAQETERSEEARQARAALDEKVRKA